MKDRTMIIFLSIFFLIFPVGLSTAEEPQTRVDDISLEPTLVYDNIVDVPPGGETRLVIDTDGSIHEEGFIGHHLETGELMEASILLPEWLKEDFIANMLEASSRPFDLGPGAIPAFGDLDADGDEDLVIGASGSLFFYRNIGTQGNPVYIEGGWNDWDWEYDTQDETNSFISPSIMDIEGDGFGDIFWGDTTQNLFLMWNRGFGNGIENDYHTMGLAYVTSLDPPTHISPAPITGDNNTIRLYFGCRQGQIYYWQFDFEDLGTTIGTTFTMAPAPMLGLGSLNYSSPRLFRDQRIAHDHHNIHGMAVGSGEGIIKYYPLINGHYTQSQTGFFLNIATQGAVTPVPSNLNGDHHVDLVLGTESGDLPLYVNYYTNDEPFWAPDPHIPAFEVENYESAFGKHLEYHDPTLIIDYLSIITDPIDGRYIDEIGFACAFTPPSQLRGNGLSQIFVDNARYIYERDTQLEYVKLVEHQGADYFTTTSYKVKLGEEFEWMDIPREEYYWGVVHPRITEETVSYIDPETGAPADMIDGGRFWREYLWEHADDEYPQGPEYPDDHSGRYVYYPRNFTPPLLKEVIDDVEYMWDLQPYSYPAGFNDAGEVNKHPWDLKDHAIEKISHWVEKTLPLNQQESLDDERPTQPVRIAATHNGNCGELQDLTIAAARSSLIPARGAHLPGEDHVWSEFYLGGWHQWDNYWSDAGGVVANDLNYWWGWGGRGGSGIWASNGAGQPFDVGQRYRSPDITGKLLVYVTDNDRNPIDGARVLVMSHWVTEQINVDTGPYQGPLPTVPLPAIWGYTDINGFCVLNVWRQNINIRVTSDLGTYVSQKFSVTENEGMTLRVVRLQNNKPMTYIPSADLPVPETGERYLTSLEIVGSYQEQEDLLGGEWYRHDLVNGGALFEIFSGSQEVGRRTSAGIMTWQGGISTMDMMDGGEKIILSISDLVQIKVNTRVRVKIWKVIETEGVDEPDLIIANSNGMNDQGVNNEDDEYIRGWIVSSDQDMLRSIEYIKVEGPMWDENFELDERPQLNWSQNIFGNRFVGIPGERNDLRVTIYDEDIANASEPLATFIWNPYIKNRYGPRWTQLRIMLDVEWGIGAHFGAYYEDPYGGLRGIGWIDDEQVWDNPSTKTIWPEHTISELIDTGQFDSGRHDISMTAIGPCGSIQPVIYSLGFIPDPPTLNLSSPNEGDQLYSNELMVSGTVDDDVSFEMLRVLINDMVWDITEDVNDQGEFGSVIEFIADPGIYAVEINSTDNVGLWTSKIVNITLLPPVDGTPPNIWIENPENGKKVEKGSIITVRGFASDNSGLTKLDLQAMGKDHDILDSLVGSTFSFSMDTSTWSTGEKKITLRGEDASGNSAIDSINVIIFEEVVEFKDRETPTIRIDEPLQGSPILIGSTFILGGQLFDDGEEIEFQISIDRGESYEDVSDTLTRDWEFELEIDTADILDGLSMDPSDMKDVLVNYPLMLRIEDGAGRELFLEYGVNIIDEDEPTLYPAKAEIDLESDRVLIEVAAYDLSNIDHFEITIISPDGVISRTIDLRYNTLKLGKEKTEGTIQINGPFENGKHSVKVEAFDGYGNSASTSTEFTVPEEESSGGGLSPLVIIAILVIIPIVAALFYGVIRIFRRKVTPNN